MKVVLNFSSNLVTVCSLIDFWPILYLVMIRNRSSLGLIVPLEQVAIHLSQLPEDEEKFNSS